MTRQHPVPITDDHGWLITPRALTSLATAVGLVYTLHAPVRYIMRMGADVDALNARVASLETEIDHQRRTIAAEELMLLEREQQSGSIAREPARRATEPTPGTDPESARHRAPRTP